MQATFIKSATKVEELPKDNKPQVAIVGRSNVGKSTLINCLVGDKKLARVSSTPGRTQTINLFEIDKRFYLVDLPGYGYAKTSKLKKEDLMGMIRDYIAFAPNIKLIILMLDARIGPTDADMDALEFLYSAQIPFNVVISKMDKLTQSESAKLTKSLESDFSGITCIQYSSITGKGRGLTWSEIEQAVHG